MRSDGERLWACVSAVMWRSLAELILYCVQGENQIENSDWSVICEDVRVFFFLLV